MRISKKQISLVRSLYNRHGRKKLNLCICEGLRCCHEVLSLKSELVEFIVCSEKANSSGLGTSVVEASEAEFDSISSTLVPQGILAVVKIPDLTEISSPIQDPFVIILDGLADPGNLGTIIRTVRAAGLRELWITAGTADPFNEKVIRSALAAQFALKIREFGTLADAAEVLRKNGYCNLFRTDPHKGISCFEEKGLFAKSAILFGSEAHGAGGASTFSPVTIPMPGGIESINVAQAATVVIFEAVRRGILK